METRHGRKRLRPQNDLVTRDAMLLGADAEQERERDTDGCAKVAHHFDTSDQQFMR